MKYFSMFSGIGGIEHGIENSYNKRDLSVNSSNECKKQSKPCCVGFSEIDKYAIQTYKKNFPKHKNWGDATKIDPRKLPEFEMLCAGFPCQSFSLAGKRKGFQDTRGTLFHEILRIVECKKPRILFLENVKGLLSADDGRCFGTIISSLDKLGYSIEWQVLNSKNFGVPQNRERVFIIGHFREKPFRQVFPIGENGKMFEEKKRMGVQEQYSSVLTSTYHKMRTFDTHIAPNKKEIDLTEIPNRPFQLTEVRTEKGKKNRKEIRQKEGRDSTLRGKDDKKYIPLNDDLANCITTGKENVEKWVFENHRIRRLTPTECERLQGFPDNWTKGVSDTQRYKQCGNAVTVNVIEAIMEKIISTKKNL